jgi:PrsW family intramembrane metalloprotease
MSGLATAATIAALLSAAVYGGALAWWAPRREAALLAAAVLLALPLAPLAYHLARAPLDSSATTALGAGAITWLRPLYAPLTEEPAKLLPMLLLPWLARRTTGANAVRVGVALGLGFGLGEIALVATLLQATPGVATAPWPSLMGFISERYMVCLVHGAFTATALTLWRDGPKSLALGLAAAMALHLLANLPIALASVLVGDPATRAAVMGLWLILFWSAAIVGLIALARHAARAAGGIDETRAA